MPKIPCPPEKQCTKIKITDGIKCINPRYRDSPYCYQHTDKGMLKQMSRAKKGKLYQISCDTCYLSQECPEFEEKAQCSFTTGVKSYDLDDTESYKKLLQKLIQMEVEGYMRAWTVERSTGKEGENVSKRFMRLMQSMEEFKRNKEKEDNKKPTSLADLIRKKEATT